MKKLKYLLAAFLSGASLLARAAGTEPADSIAAAGDVRLERGIVDTRKVFVPRGKWMAGGYVSYSTHKNNQYDLLVIEDIQSDGYSFKISPMGGYTVRDNMVVGARLQYDRSLLQSDGGTGYVYSLRHAYQAALFWRQYIPLNQRIALFNELTLAGGGHQSKFASGAPVSGTYESGFELSLGASPGLAAFVSKSMAVEVNVGVMGLNYERSKQIQNQVSSATIAKSYMNFNVNLLAIRLGVVFFI